MRILHQVNNILTIEIDKEEYEQLKKDQEFLQALEECGVDNWEGYEEAIRRTSVI